jgi:hypothetical protein
MMSWIIAHRANFKQRERKLLCLAGLSTDIDGIGLILDVITVKHKIFCRVSPFFA